jgi:hypothetical protein
VRKKPALERLLLWERCGFELFLGPTAETTRGDIVPKEHEIYAFLLPDKSITIKRVIKLHKEYLIIDKDKEDKEERKSRDLKVTQ